MPDPATQPADVCIEVGRRTARLYGRGLTALLDRIGSPRMWDPVDRKILTCPAGRVAELVDLLERREHRTVEVVAVDR